MANSKKPLLARPSWRLLLLLIRYTTRFFLALQTLGATIKKQFSWRGELPATAAIVISLIVVGIVFRLIPHAPNFTPVGAIALFGGAVLSARLAIWLPVAIMIGSDLFLGAHGTMLFTYGGYALVGMFGMLLRNSSNSLRIPVGTLGGALIFYIVSNFGVWVEGKLYPHTFQGLVDCYVAALPFFRNSLVADLVFTTLLFGTYALSRRMLTHRAVQAVK